MVEKADQFCVACGLVAPRGPRGFEWDVHRVIPGMEGEMHATCSPECRATLGLVERKVWPEPPPPDVEGW